VLLNASPRARLTAAIAAIFVTIGLITVYALFIRPDGASPFPTDTLRPTLDLSTPTFLPDGRWLYAENQRGNIRLVDASGTLFPDPVISLPVTSEEGEGLLGLAVDPNFAQNHFIWVYYTQPSSLEPPYPRNKVARFELIEDSGQNLQEMFSVPVTTGRPIHMGGQIGFDAQGYLLVSVGEFDNPAFSQERTGLAGRIHRFEVSNGVLLPAADNPFAGNSTYAYGLRNPYGFDIDPLSGALFATDNGPDCDDEINLIFPGGNYGWRPDYPCDDIAPTSAATYTYPIWFMRWSEGISGMIFYQGSMFPDWQGDLLFCAWNFGAMRRAELNADRDLITAVRRVPLDGASCAIDLAVAPDGSIYFTDAAAIYRLSAISQ
jgi:glucose/arabinose dehydrogenase